MMPIIPQIVYSHIILLYFLKKKWHIFVILFYFLAQKAKQRALSSTAVILFKKNSQNEEDKKYQNFNPFYRSKLSIDIIFCIYPQQMLILKLYKTCLLLTYLKMGLHTYLRKYEVKSTKGAVLYRKGPRLLITLGKVTFKINMASSAPNRNSLILVKS